MYGELQDISRVAADGEEGAIGLLSFFSESGEDDIGDFVVEMEYADECVIEEAAFVVF